MPDYIVHMILMGVIIVVTVVILKSDNKSKIKDEK